MKLDDLIFKSRSSLDTDVAETNKGKAVKKDKGPIESLIGDFITDDLGAVGEVINNQVKVGIAGLLKDVCHNAIDVLFKNPDKIPVKFNSLYDNRYWGRRNYADTANSSIGIDSNNRTGTIGRSRTFDSRNYPFTRGKAEVVKEELLETSNRTGQVTLADFLKHTTTNPIWTDTEIGWKNLDSILLRPINSDGDCVLVLPPIVSLK